MTHILFVCHGNICRSPMAEFYFKHLVHKAGRDEEFAIASAATSREEIGNDVHWGTKDMLTERGIPYSRRKARQITVADYERNDYIITFDAENEREITRLIGSDRDHKVYSLLSFAGLDRDVADPWYTGDFRQTYADVERGCQALWQYLR